MAIGEIPGTGFQLVDGAWLNGLASGHNFLNQSGVTALGTDHASSTQLADRIAMFDIDTSSASTGVSLPPALKGVVIMLYNNTSNNISVFPSIANNPVTAAQDTINNTTSVTVNAHTAEIFFCAKNGVWAAK